MKVPSVSMTRQSYWQRILNCEAQFLSGPESAFRLEDMVRCALMRAARSNPSCGRRHPEFAQDHGTNEFYLWRNSATSELLLGLIAHVRLGEDDDATFRLGTPLPFSHSRKSQRDGPEKTLTGDFSLRQAFHAEKVSEDVATGRPCRHLASTVLCTEARQAAVESVASAADAAVHICGGMSGRNRSPIANLRRLS